MFRLPKGISDEGITALHMKRTHGAAKFKADKKHRKTANESRRRNRVG